MSEIRLIASDLDGTLLLDHATELEDGMFDVIRRLKEEGRYFMPASGRQHQSLQRLFGPVKDEILYVCENGALVIYQDEIIYKKQFEEGLSYEICESVLKEPDCEILISGERTSYLLPKDPGFETYIQDGLGNRTKVVKCLEQIPEPIIKVAFYMPEHRRDAVLKKLGEQYQGRCLLMTSGNEWLDFAPLGTGKGEALRAVGKELGIAASEMAAFGDNENDRNMLEYVGHPFLMRPCNPTMEDINARRCTSVKQALEELFWKDSL